MPELAKLTFFCETCNHQREGFQIPDGRLICEGCAPGPVYDRWASEWLELERVRQKEEVRQRKESEAAAAKLELAERKRSEAEAKREQAVEAVKARRAAAMAQNSESLPAQPTPKSPATPRLPRVNWFFLVLSIFCLLTGVFFLIQASHESRDLAARWKSQVLDFSYGGPDFMADDRERSIQRLREAREFHSAIGVIAFLMGGVCLVIAFAAPQGLMAAIARTTGRWVGANLPREGHDRQPCPRCGESIPVAAKVCRFCQHSLT